MKARVIRRCVVSSITVLLSLTVFCGCVYAVTPIPTSGGVELPDAYYRADTPFAQYAYFWKDSGQDEWKALEEAAKTRTMGGSIHIFLRNGSQQPIAVQDVLLEGISLKKAIAFSDQRKFKKVTYAAGIYFSDLTEDDLREKATDKFYEEFELIKENVLSRDAAAMLGKATITGIKVNMP